MSNRPTAPVTQADLDAAEAEAMKAIDHLRSYRERWGDNPSDIRSARLALRALKRFIRVRERMVTQERRALALRDVPKTPKN